MQFSLTADQQLLGSATAELLDDVASLAATRARVDAGEPPDPAVWSALSDMGATAVDLPEDHGGTGLTVVELAVVMERAGAVLYPGPLLASTGFAAGLVAGDDEASASWSRRLAEGAVGAAAVPDRPGPWSAAGVTTTADRLADGWRLRGVKDAVLQADQADALFVAARSDDGEPALFAVRPADVRIEVLPSLDGARSLCRVTFDDAPAELVSARAGERIRRAGLRAGTALAAESVGAARAALELTASFARERRQFGQPIGAFQAVKHPLADLLADVELATSAVYLAACHLAAGDTESASASAPLALHAATETLARAGARAVQLHGGMGFTWESPCHRYVTWGQTSRWLLGSATGLLEEMYDRAPSMAG